MVNKSVCYAQIACYPPEQLDCCFCRVPRPLAPMHLNVSTPRPLSKCWSTDEHLDSRTFPKDIVGMWSEEDGLKELGIGHVMAREQQSEEAVRVICDRMWESCIIAYVRIRVRASYVLRVRMYAAVVHMCTYVERAYVYVCESRV